MAPDHWYPHIERTAFYSITIHLTENDVKQLLLSDHADVIEFYYISCRNIFGKVNVSKLNEVRPVSEILHIGTSLE